MKQKNSSKLSINDEGFIYLFDTMNSKPKLFLGFPTGKGNKTRVDDFKDR